ncbi:MAG: hypothetical protein V3R75_01375 [Alphaproteobacteria bacterium]
MAPLLEQQLTGLLVQFELLGVAWPKAPPAVDLASIGRERCGKKRKLGLIALGVAGRAIRPRN